MKNRLERLQLETCWQSGFTGAGIRIGHLDTGVDATHPLLHDRIQTFAQFDEWGDRVSNNVQQAQQAQPWDSGNHGTHTAGLLMRIAPDAHLCSGMVIEGGHPLLRVLAGLDWLLDQQVRVLCLSLGVPGYNPLFESVMARLRQQGVLVVCPIGNQGARVSCSPANYPNVLAVGAIDEQNQVPRFSGRGAAIVAPGVDVISTQPGGQFASQTGTSMAAAIVAGVAALLFQAKPTATVEEVEYALLSSCTALPLSADRVGHGLVNPIAAIDHIMKGDIGSIVSSSFAPATPKIDPRLKRHLENAQSNSQSNSQPEEFIAAIAIVTDQRVIDRIQGNPPTQVRFFPRSNAIGMMATAEFLTRLLQEPEVCFLSSTTIDVIYFG